MKRTYTIMLSLLLCALTAFGKNSPQIQAAYDLIERVTPGYGSQFCLELTKPVGGEDAYEIGTKNGRVLLRGNNTVAIATAFNQYLKYTCHTRQLVWQPAEPASTSAHACQEGWPTSR